ncbi:Phosphatidylethanolamine-binding protein 1 [Smittium mucronatum]|uniref:Phosphatidylethanolamine-binding protein 1 n=1 Tax=Smittium mucronatum TaxID=133383 RepID=A0A1R0GYU1_9FUNG|nr:Phosphatidylethanolamine-binding protein 1 [Smittium mucronatum]
MQRSYQMYIIPDVIDPKGFESFSTQLNLSFKGISENPIEPGARIEPESAKELPEISLLNFSETPKLYTIVMVDPDEPNQEIQSYAEQCHWAVCNVKFDIFNQKYSPESGNGETAIKYTPPHPAYGTKTHRYIFVALLQGENGTLKISPDEFLKFNGLRSFTKDHNLTPVGVSFFRSEWNQTVDKIYTDVLGVKPPRFGLPLVENPNIGKDGEKLPAYENI